MALGEPLREWDAAQSPTSLSLGDSSLIEGRRQRQTRHTEQGTGRGTGAHLCVQMITHVHISAHRHNTYIMYTRAHRLMQHVCHTQRCDACVHEGERHVHTCELRKGTCV